MTKFWELKGKRMKLAIDLKTDQKLKVKQHKINLE